MGSTGKLNDICEDARADLPRSMRPPSVHESSRYRVLRMIIVFGSINVDLVFRLRDTPVPVQTLLAEDLTVQPGGKGANQAVAAARDGADVRMAGAVGDDALAAMAMAGLRDAGVALTGVRSHAGVATGCASIWINAAGENQIVVALGANLLLEASQVDDALLGSGTTVLLQMEGDPAAIAAVIRRSRRAGCRVILNLAPAVMLDPGVLRLLDVLVVNEDEAAVLASSLGCAPRATALQEVLGVSVLRTLGAAGAEAATAEGEHHFAAARVEVVDTTAAGDCFVGVLAAALDRGLDLQAGMRRACAAAALACTLAGSQRSLPDSASIDGLEAVLRR